MSEFEIHEQKKLSFGKCIELVLSGIQFRLFRAFITVAIIALAVAFLMTILGDSLVGREVAMSLDGIMQPRREFLFWVHRLSSPLSESDLATTLLSAEPGDARWEELKRWSGSDDAAVAELKKLSIDERVYLDFFAGLKESQRRPLVGRARGRDIFRRLQDPEQRKAFRAALPDIGKPIPRSLEEFESLLKDWQRTAALRRRIVDGHGESLRAFQALLAGRTVPQFLSTLNLAGLERVKALGFGLAADQVESLQDLAASSLDQRQIEQLLRSTVLKQRFAIRHGIQDINKVSAILLFSKIRSRREAEWLKAQAADIGSPIDLPAERITRTADNRMSRERLTEIETAVEGIETKTGWLGFSNRVMWVIIVSLIVCAVGITNAMLMSVTERFTEIATMKCLGATDGFIMVNFLLESGLQGFAGGIVGGILGFVLGILRASISFGAMAFQNVPFAAMVVVFLLCLGIGILLSIVAAIYPAWVAARLAPMEAMRVE